MAHHPKRREAVILRILTEAAKDYWDRAVGGHLLGVSFEPAK
jgi:hypothetical protein